MVKKRKKSQKYISLKSEFDQKLKKAASEFITKCVTDLSVHKFNQHLTGPYYIQLFH